MNLRPYEVKRLLYHIISGEEFRVDDGTTAVQIVKESPSLLARKKISIKAVKRRDTAGIIQLGQDVRGVRKIFRNWRRRPPPRAFLLDEFSICFL